MKSVITGNIVRVAVNSGNSGEAHQRTASISPNPLPQQIPKRTDMHEGVPRPEQLEGTTYKIKSAGTDRAIYLTINDIILNGDERRPYEIFINTKDPTHYQWIAGLTLLMSAVFRKGGDVTFVIEQMKSVFDPRGSYFLPDGKGQVPSLLAEIGGVIEQHFIKIGLLPAGKVLDLPNFKEATAHAKEVMQEFDKKLHLVVGENKLGWCPKCSNYAVTIASGCKTCTNCGDSTCG